MSKVPTLEDLENQVAVQNEALRACEQLAATISAEARIDINALTAFDELTEPPRPVVSPLINGLRA